ncbi:MAG: 3-oxoadipate enol-lactonase, partial [Pseudomonadota bacterium]|nr:3-oxoadipate enol-lactonase [Pseudomonadota bacterium]
PTAIIAAGDDPVTPVDHAEAMRDRIAGARLDVIAGQRHFSNVELPGQFNPLLRRHLDANQDAAPL